MGERKSFHQNIRSLVKELEARRSFPGAYFHSLDRTRTEWSALSGADAPIHALRPPCFDYRSWHGLLISSVAFCGRFDGLYFESTRVFSSTVECTIDPSGIPRLAPSGVRHLGRLSQGS